jgi:hypothetical protein
MIDNFFKNSKSVFKSQKDFDKFRDDFCAKIRPELEKLDEKRRKSEIALRNKWYR